MNKPFSQKDIYSMVVMIANLLKDGQTGFSPRAADHLAKRLEQTIISHFPEKITQRLFEIKIDGEIVECRFARLPPHVKHVRKQGIYQVNAAIFMPDHLLYGQEETS